MNDRTSRDSEGARIEHALNWALEAAHDPAMAAADWLVRDLSAAHDTAIGLIIDPDSSLDDLILAKTVFKTMRMVGETPHDRRLGARLYAASIAAALVHHGKRISEQSPEALRKALASIESDTDMPDSLRNIAALAIAALRAQTSPDAH